MTKEESAYNTPDFVFGAAAPANPGETLPAKVGFEATWSTRRKRSVSGKSTWSWNPPS